MPSGHGFEQAYNAQIAVDVSSMLVISGHVSQHTNDKQELKPALDCIAGLPQGLGTVDTLIADSGYLSEANVGSCEKRQITPYIAAGRETHNQPLMERFLEPPPVPDDADAITRMQHLLKTVALEGDLCNPQGHGGTGIRYHQSGDGVPQLPPPGL